MILGGAVARAHGLGLQTKQQVSEFVFFFFLLRKKICYALKKHKEKKKLKNSAVIKFPNYSKCVKALNTKYSCEGGRRQSELHVP